jgi:hypothetical protein
LTNPLNLNMVNWVLTLATAEAAIVDPAPVARLTRRAQRGASDPRPAPRDVRSPIALVISALALEVKALGVPEGHRARARAVLLDLSRNLERRTSRGGRCHAFAWYAERP